MIEVIDEDEGKGEGEVKQEEVLSEEEQQEYDKLRKAYLEKRAPDKCPARSAPQRSAATRGAMLPSRILKLGVNIKVGQSALDKLNGLHRKRQYKSALVFLQGLRDYQRRVHMPLPGILRDPNVENLEAEKVIDLTGEDEEPAPSRAGAERVIIDLEKFILSELELAEIHKPKTESPHV